MMVHWWCKAGRLDSCITERATATINTTMKMVSGVKISGGLENYSNALVQSNVHQYSDKLRLSKSTSKPSLMRLYLGNSFKTILI